MPGSIRQIKIRKQSKYRSSGQKKVTLKRILKKKEKRVRFYLLIGGLLLIFAAFYTSLKNNSVPGNSPAQSENIGENLSASFASEPVSVDKKLLASPDSKAPPKSPPVRIVIPSLNIDLPVKEAKIVNGYWEVFPDSAGFGLGSAYPEDAGGNQVIFAHARQGLFGSLRDIKTGADIIVMTQTHWYTYTVDNIKEVLPSQTEVIAPTEDPVLTLYTCSGYADSKRLIVTARKM